MWNALNEEILHKMKNFKTIFKIVENIKAKK